MPAEGNTQKSTDTAEPGDTEPVILKYLVENADGVFNVNAQIDGSPETKSFWGTKLMNAISQFLDFINLNSDDSKGNLEG